METETASVVARLQATATLRLDQVELELEGVMLRRKELDDVASRLGDERTQLRALLATYGAEPLREPARIATGLPSKSLADHVYELLLATDQPLHYREIERELRARGLFMGTGADPANALLATYFNDSRLYRPARGTYAVRPKGQTVQSVGSKRSGRRAKTTHADASGAHKIATPGTKPKTAVERQRR